MECNAEFRSINKAWLMIWLDGEITDRGFRVSHDDVKELLESLNFLDRKFTEAEALERGGKG